MEIKIFNGKQFFIQKIEFEIEDTAITGSFFLMPAYDKFQNFQILFCIHCAIIQNMLKSGNAIMKFAILRHGKILILKIASKMGLI